MTQPHAIGNLEQCFSGIEACAALLATPGGEPMEAVGGLSTEQAAKISARLARCCAQGRLAFGFVSLEGLGECLLAAASADGVTIGVLFDPDTKLSQARQRLLALSKCFMAEPAAKPQAEEPPHEDDFWDEPLPEEAFVPLFDAVPPPDPEETKPTPKPQPPRSPLPPRPLKTCACVIVPLFQYSLSPYAEEISRLLPDLAQKHGWKLIDTRLAPDYLLFAVEVKPEESLNAILGTVRRHIAQAALGEDAAFWYNSYLISAGKIPVSMAARFAASVREADVNPRPPEVFR